MADEKSYLRAVLSEARGGLTAASAAARSAAVERRVLGMPAYRAAAKIVLYAPLGCEVETRLIAADVLRTRRQLYYPIIDRRRGTLGLGAAAEPDELHPGAFGIPEPSGASVLEPGEIDAALVCVPGLAFTRAGARLGRGGGYYDRLIAALAARTVTAGLGYSFQLLDRLPQESHDRRLDFVVTESAVYAAGEAPPAAAQAADQGG